MVPGKQGGLGMPLLINPGRFPSPDRLPNDRGGGGGGGGGGGAPRLLPAPLVRKAEPPGGVVGQLC